MDGNQWRQIAFAGPKSVSARSLLEISHWNVFQSVYSTRNSDLGRHFFSYSPIPTFLSHLLLFLSHKISLLKLPISPQFRVLWAFAVVRSTQSTVLPFLLHSDLRSTHQIVSQTSDAGSPCRFPPPTSRKPVPISPLLHVIRTQLFFMSFVQCTFNPVNSSLTPSPLKSSILQPDCITDTWCRVTGFYMSVPLLFQKASSISISLFPLLHVICTQHLSMSFIEFTFNRVNSSFNLQPCTVNRSLKNVQIFSATDKKCISIFFHFISFSLFTILKRCFQFLCTCLFYILIFMVNIESIWSEQFSLCSILAFFVNN